MREILFRGKRLDNGEWVYGSLVCLPGNNEIGYIAVFMEDEAGFVLADNIEVNLNTVGQYTGNKDKNDRRIFEGDIVRMRSPRFALSGFGPIVFYSGRFAIIDSKRHRNYLLDDYPNEYQIVGNIHDNPELLEGKA